MGTRENTYLLYEYSKKLAYTVKIRVDLDAKVDQNILNKAAQEAISRFPYYHIKVVIENGGYAFVPNENPIAVLPEQDKRLVLGSDEVGKNLFAITYKDNSVWFCFSHTLCGGYGALFWIKTTLYQYMCALYGELEPPKDLKAVGDKPGTEELSAPDPDSLPTDEPIKRYTGGDSNVGSIEYLQYFFNPFAKDNYVYDIDIPYERFINYCRSIDASPNTAIAAITYKALAKFYRKLEKEDDFIGCRIADDYRGDISSNASYRDYVRFIHVRYDWKEKDSTIARLSMIARGAIIFQMQPELSYEQYRKVCKVHEGIDAQPTLKEKIKYSRKNGLYRSDPRDSYTISYVGQVDWGGMAEHIMNMYTHSDGHNMLEVNVLKDKFCISFQLLNKDEMPVKLFCDVLKDENIPFECSGRLTRHLPEIELPVK
ncbi:MAG: hypothetical protein K6G03_07625 [Lachnospiraceae bacterium]|nr:hypothetical protein [Lachnospiraceae bacterium]